MIYVALLRGINVGGNARVEMPRLKTVFEKLGYGDVRTFINSGNVIFSTSEGSRTNIVESIERAIAKEFGLTIVVVIRSLVEIQKLVKKIPDDWTNGAGIKTDVMFLWEHVDDAKVLDGLAIKPELETVFYHPGAIVWHVTHENFSRGGMSKIIGTPLYKGMTIRNVNSVRKILSLMEAAAQSN